MGPKNAWMIPLCVACMIAAGQMLPDFIRSHASTTPVAITIAVKHANWYAKGVPEEPYEPARTPGKCHALQIDPLNKHAFRNPTHFVSSGTRKPRHPISSPRLKIIAGSRFTMEINPNAATITTQFGSVG